MHLASCEISSELPPILVSNKHAVSRLGHAIALFIEVVNTVGLIGASWKVQKSE